MRLLHVFVVIVSFIIAASHAHAQSIATIAGFADLVEKLSPPGHLSGRGCPQYVEARRALGL